MKLTKQILKQIIKEEIQAVLVESLDDADAAQRFSFNDEAPESTDVKIQKAIDNYKKSKGRRNETYAFDSLVTALRSKYNKYESGKAREEAEEIKAQLDAEEKKQRDSWEQSKNITPEEQEALQTYYSNYRRGNVIKSTQELVKAVGAERAAKLLAKTEMGYDPDRFANIMNMSPDY